MKIHVSTMVNATLEVKQTDEGVHVEITAMTEPVANVYRPDGESLSVQMVAAGLSFMLDEAARNIAEKAELLTKEEKGRVLSIVPPPPTEVV